MGLMKTSGMIEWHWDGKLGIGIGGGRETKNGLMYACVGVVLAGE